MIAEGFNWWVEGLATAWLSLESRLHRARRFRLTGASAPFVLVPRDAVRNAAAGTIEIPEQLLPDALAQIRQRARGSVFEIVIPAAALLERQLDPLPRESKPYIESVVRHQIEAIFPWSSKDTVHATRVEDRSDGKIDVKVQATSRVAIEPALAIAGACEASEVVLISTDANGQSVAEISIPLGKQAADARERARTIARYAVLGLLIVATCAIGWTSFMHWSAASELGELERAIADRRALLQRASATGDAAGRNGLEAKRDQGPLAVLIIERLSQLLPDDTYLTDLSLDGERLRISGVSGQAPELVPLLEKSGYFRSVSFYAPTTRLAGDATDRFSIEALVASRSEVKP